MGQRQKSRKAEKSPLNFKNTWKIEKYSGQIQRKVEFRMLFYATVINSRQRPLQVWSLDVFRNVHSVVNIDHR